MSFYSNSNSFSRGCTSEATKSELVNFVIKFLFVVYFSVGININPGSGNDLDRMGGMIQVKLRHGPFPLC